MSNKNYKDLSKEELIEKIEKLESRKKYGLIWDEEKTKEKFEKDAENALPVLKEIKGKEIKTDDESPINILIEGDNYHALSVLNFTHQGKIDVIYIDPPYNTGKKDEWIYNDKYIDETDSYRHSKWLSFMSKRLKLAKKLLSEKGVVFISIDDNEEAQLKMLCDSIFGENNFERFIWKKKGGAGNTERIVGNLTEHILCYFKNKKPGVFNYRNIERQYKYKDEIGPYNLAGIEKTNLGSYERKTMTFPITDPKTKKKFLPGHDMRWTSGEASIKRMIEEEKIYFDYKKSKVLVIKRPEDYEESSNVFYNLLTDFGSLSTAKSELYDYFGNREIFDTPKPTQLLIHLLEISSKKDSIILDFFAGSGTIGQAVLEYNKKIGGNRQFILCTNDEGKICTEICYPRVSKTINGYKTPKNEYIKGLGGNLKYYKTAFVKNSVSRDEMKMKITGQCTEMLCLREGIFEEIKSLKSYKIFKQNNKIMAVYYSLEKDKLDSLKNSLDKIKGEKVLYCFTLDYLGLDKNDFIGWDDIRLEPIPQKILDVYKDIYEY